MRPLSARVTIASVSSAPVRGGFTRFTVAAERVENTGRMDHWLTFTTLNDFKASLCLRARETGVPLDVTYRSTGYFDADLLSAELVEAR